MCVTQDTDGLSLVNSGPLGQVGTVPDLYTKKWEAGRGRETQM